MKIWRRKTKLFINWLERFGNLRSSLLALPIKESGVDLATKPWTGKEVKPEDQEDLRIPDPVGYGSFFRIRIFFMDLKSNSFKIKTLSSCLKNFYNRIQSRSRYKNVNFYIKSNQIGKLALRCGVENPDAGLGFGSLYRTRISFLRIWIKLLFNKKKHEKFSSKLFLSDSNQNIKVYFKILRHFIYF